MNLYQDVAKSHPKLARGRVWCTTCRASHVVNVVKCMREGWPKCCGYTMTIDSPEERARDEGCTQRFAIVAGRL